MGAVRDMRGVLAAWCLAAVAAEAVAEPRVLFIRGADRSGGFFEADTDFERTEHLGDINNQSTANGNHGWYELAQLLRADGFTVEQITEKIEPGAPQSGSVNGEHINLEQMDLSVYDVIVMGSNNAVYDTAAIDAFEDYILDGGAALFISDAGFGSSWPDASDSDQQFLDRFGWTMQQDYGFYGLSRDEGDFVEPAHPILDGVDEIEGEGESPIVRPVKDVAGVHTTIVVRAKPGERTRNNNGNPGTFRDVTARDATTIIATAGCGRLAGHFDRNTFFNESGAGTNINQLDHAVYALNLFRWLAGAGAADLAVPMGVLDYSDVLAFMVAFAAEGAEADLSAPFGAWDFSDVLSFLQAFTGGCP